MPRKPSEKLASKRLQFSGERFHAFLKQNGIKIRWAANNFGCTIASLYKYIYNEVEPPGWLVVGFSDHFGVDPRIFYDSPISKNSSDEIGLRY